MEQEATMSSIPSLTLAEMRAVYARIAEHIHRTPVLTCGTFDAIAGRKLYFKCENLQKTGAFKARGACNAVLKAKEDLGESLTGDYVHEAVGSMTYSLIVVSLSARQQINDEQ
jgi:threonine dehydratase